MGKNRLEAFSDGVIAILITIMVLELKVPHGESWGALLPLWPVFLSYVLSFVNIGIYWNNHHHLLHAAHRVTGGMLWANLHLLFWLSLLSFATGWMGENHFAALPVAVYGVLLMLCGFAYLILQRSILATLGPNSALQRALGRDRKGKISQLIYLLAAPTALWLPQVALVCYVAVALMWLVPDKRIERGLSGDHPAP